MVYVSVITVRLKNSLRQVVEIIKLRYVQTIMIEICCTLKEKGYNWEITDLGQNITLDFGFFYPFQISEYYRFPKNYINKFRKCRYSISFNF
ncbi:hypothetical protein ES708_33660 [subsurface metagenome]